MMGTENRWACHRRHRRLLLARNEEKGKISGAKNTLKLEELHRVEAIQAACAEPVGVAAVEAPVNVVLDAPSVDGRRR